MSEASLEWTSPAGPAALGLLAGPWRRRDLAVDDPTEVFRARVPADGATRSADPLQAILRAAGRLRAALQTSSAARPPAEAELLRALAGDGAGLVLDIGPWLAELTRRGTGLARVETMRGESPCVVTIISMTGGLSTHRLAGAPAELSTMHRQAVAAALHTRGTLLRAVLTTTELAAIIATLAGPAALGLALPLAWRFLHTLLAEHASSNGD